MASYWSRLIARLLVCCCIDRSPITDDIPSVSLRKGWREFVMRSDIYSFDEYGTRARYARRPICRDVGFHGHRKLHRRHAPATTRRIAKLLPFHYFARSVGIT